MNIFQAYQYQIINKEYRVNISDHPSIKKYAERVFDTNIDQYRRRNKNISDEKMFEDIYLSKLTEVISLRCALEMYGEKHGFKVIKDVDFCIYQKERKGWSPDFIGKIDGVRINNECKSSPKKYGNCNIYRLSYDGSENLIGYVKKQNTYTFQEESVYFKDGYVYPDGECGITWFLQNNIIEKTMVVKAWVRNELVKKMFVNPFSKTLWIHMGASGLTGKKCIMQETCGTNNGFPCGIDELPNRVIHEN